MSIFTQRTQFGDHHHLLHRLKRMLALSVESADAAPLVNKSWPSNKPPNELPAGLYVLVVDDNPVNLILAEDMLIYLGVKPLLAADGAEAVALAAEVRTHLILMDLQMPVLDGLGATRQIRSMELQEKRARVPVVAYTCTSPNVATLQEHGIDDVLEKPCELSVMHACLLRWCATHEVAERTAHSVPA
jgi:CheY-like chemotaxis protein